MNTPGSDLLAFCGNMAERSKAPVLGTGLRAWVRTPLLSSFFCMPWYLGVFFANCAEYVRYEPGIQRSFGHLCVLGHIHALIEWYWIDFDAY